MLQFALFLICFAQLIHLSRYWLTLSRALYAEHSDRKLKDHLDWSARHGRRRR